MGCLRVMMGRRNIETPKIVRITENRKESDATLPFEAKGILACI